MTVSEYYNSVADFWDMDYSEAEMARAIAAAVSVPRDGGGLALDIGCGNGGMILDLLRYGACEIEGVDISERMVSIAQEKYSFDPRIHIEHADFLSFEHSGYDLAVAFNSYHHFLCPKTFVKKAHSLLREDGRLTIAYGFDSQQTNKMNGELPSGFFRPLLPAEKEAEFWSPYFQVDFICDTASIYMISGRAVQQ